MARKVSYYDTNKAALEAFCAKHGYEYEWKNAHQVRVYSGVVIADFWIARMVYHILNIDGVQPAADFQNSENYRFDAQTFQNIMERGKA